MQTQQWIQLAFFYFLENVVYFGVIMSAFIFENEAEVKPMTRIDLHKP
jgi:hypothetical protein